MVNNPINYLKLPLSIIPNYLSERAKNICKVLTSILFWHDTSFILTQSHILFCYGVSCLAEANSNAIHTWLFYSTFSRYRIIFSFFYMNDSINICKKALHSLSYMCSSHFFFPTEHSHQEKQKQSALKCI